MSLSPTIRVIVTVTVALSLHITAVTACMTLTLTWCLHDTGATFIPARVHPGSLLWLCICLHDTTTKCHASASHTGASSPRFLCRSEIFINAVWLFVSYSLKFHQFYGTIRGCLHDTGATFIPGRDEKLHCVYIKPCWGASLIVPENWWNFNEYERPWNEQSYRVYMTPEWIFVPGCKSRSGTRTGVNSHQYDSRQHDILWWYHVNEYRAIRGNRGELAPGWKSPRYYVNTT